MTEYLLKNKSVLLVSLNGILLSLNTKEKLEIKMFIDKC